MAKGQPPGQQRNAFGRDYGNYAIVALMPNGSGNVLPSASVPFELEAGDRCYLTLVGSEAEYICANPGTSGGGDAWWYQAPPPGFLSVVAYGAKGNDPGNGSGTDDGPAVAACAAAAIAHGKNVWFPNTASNALWYRLATGTTFTPGATDQATIAVCGPGGTQILVDCPGQDALRFDNFLQVFVGGFAFRGISGLTRLYDCYQCIFPASSRGVVIRDCSFKWLAASGPGVISAGNAEFSVFDCKFGGCAGATSVVSGVNVSRQHVQRVTFDDQGLINGDSTGAKSALVLTPAWIQSKDPSALVGGFSQSTLVIQECWFDETSLRAILVSSAAAQLYAALIEDCEASAYGHAPAAGFAVFDFSNIARLDINRCFTAELVAGSQQRDALRMSAVTRTHLNGFRCATVAADANRIVTDAACASLVMDGMAQATDYRTLSADPATVVTNTPNPVGPASSTDKALVRWSGTTGGILQDGTAVESDLGALKSADGAVGSPTYSFLSETNTGPFRVGAGLYAIAAAGLEVARFSAPGGANPQILRANGTAAKPSSAFTSDTGTGAYRVGASDYGIATGGVLRLDVSTTAVTSTLGLVLPLGATGAGNLALQIGSTAQWGAYADNANLYFTQGSVKLASFSSSATLDFWYSFILRTMVAGTYLTYSSWVTAVALVGHTFDNSGVAFAGSAGVQTGVRITHEVNAAGTAAFTSLDIAQKVTAVGSGPQYLINAKAGAGGTTQEFAVDTTGVVTSNGSNPFTDAASDLGSASFRWRDLYLSGGVRGGFPISTVAFAGLFTGAAGAVTNYAANGGPGVATVAGQIGFPVATARRGGRLVVNPISNSLLGSCVITVYKNNVATGITVTVPSLSTAQVSDLVHVADFTALDEYDLVLAETGAGAFTFSATFEFWRA